MVDASAPRFGASPSKSSDLLQPLIAACGANTACILPCSLANLAENALYGLEIKGANRNLPCKLGLVCWCRAKRARCKSKAMALYVLTEGITDGGEDENVNGSWTTRAMCSSGNSLQMRLDPPKFWAKTMVLSPHCCHRPECSHHHLERGPPSAIQGGEIHIFTFSAVTNTP